MTSHRRGPTLGLLVLLAACTGRDLEPTDSASGASSSSDTTTATTSTTATSPATSQVTDVTTIDPPTTSAATTATSSIPTTTTMTPADLPGDTTGEPALCDRPGGCHRLDILVVVDNSRGMGVKQANFTAGLPHLVDRLRGLVDEDGLPVDPDVNLMVTTTDTSALPLCKSFAPDGYTAAMGAPTTTPCVDRLTHFTGLGDDDDMPQICTDACPMDQVAVAADPFVHFSSSEHNVMGPGDLADPVLAALKCLVPQGICGCGFETPLESMRRALDPAAAWNQGSAPFLREGAALAVIVLTDEADCSVADARYFDNDLINDPEFGQYFPVIPNTMEKTGPTSGNCWLGGMTCQDDDDGVYESCVPEDKGPLLPLSDYTTLLREQFEDQAGKPVFMLLMAGVPHVTAHDPNPPHQPTQGGAFDLVYRDWLDSDILPDDTDTAFNKQVDFVIGPACAVESVGYGLPPGRMLELCRALDRLDDPRTPTDESEPRCCVESVCDADAAPAFDCLAGLLAQQLTAQR